MDLIQLIFISLVQGVTEFLPISSSANLVLLPQLMDWNDQALSIDVAAHLGSLFAVLFYFRNDFRKMVVNGFGPTLGVDYDREYYKLFWLVIIASIPLLIVAFLIRDEIALYFRDPLIIASATIFFGILLWLSDLIGKQYRTMNVITKKDAFIIGLSQILALIPGTSRSGVTMTTGLLLGFNRHTAVKFSFFMSVPIISLAALYEASNLIQYDNDVVLKNFMITVFCSAVSSLITIHIFLKFINKLGMLPFVIYRLVLGIILLFLYL